MYKINDINGEVSTLVYLQDSDKNEYTSCWCYEIYELEELYDLEFKGIPSENEILKVIKEVAIQHTEMLIASYSVNNMDMIVEGVNSNNVDYRELKLDWKCVDKETVGITYIDYKDIEFVEL